MRLSFETPLIGHAGETLDLEIPVRNRQKRQQRLHFTYSASILNPRPPSMHVTARMYNERGAALALTLLASRGAGQTPAFAPLLPPSSASSKTKRFYIISPCKTPPSSQFPCSPLSLKRRERPRTSSHRPIPPNSSQQPRAHAFAILRFSFSNAASILAYLLLSSESKYGCSSASVAWMRLAGSYTSIF